VRLAPAPPWSSVLPPGAGNEEPKKALKPDDEGPKKGEERTVRQAGVVQWQLHATTVRRDDDGDVASIAAIEQTQRGLPNEPGRPGRFAQSTGRSVNVQPPGPHRTIGTERCSKLQATDQTSGDRRSPGGLAATPGPVELAPAVPCLEHDGSAGDCRDHQEDPEGLSLQQPSHLLQSQRTPAPMVRAMEATIAMTQVKRARIAFTM
jgi:hypothetical protein